MTPSSGAFRGLGKPVVGGTEGLNAADIYGKDADGQYSNVLLIRRHTNLGRKNIRRIPNCTGKNNGKQYVACPQDMLPKGLLSEKPAGYKRKGIRTGIPQKYRLLLMALRELLF